MSTITLAFDAVFPILATMAIGFAARKAGLLDDNLIKKTNRLVFCLFLPVLIFVNLYGTDFMSYLDVRLIIFVAVTTIVIFLAAFMLVPLFEKENSRRGVVIQGMVRGNVVYIGLPVLITLAGNQYAGLMALAIVTTVLLYNITSIIALETFRHSKIAIVPILKGIATNPLILGALTAVIFVSFDIPIGDTAWSVLDSVSGVATPLALVLLGGSIRFSHAKKYRVQIFFTVFVKLILAPAIFIPIAIFLGYAHYELVVIFVVLAAPTAVATFTVAQNMGGDGDLAAQIVAWSSTFSLGTIFLWIIILQNYILP